MGTLNIIKCVDIDASQEEVFKLIVDAKRRMQLAPTWGENKIDHIPPGYPEKGSRIRLTPKESEEADQPGFDVIITEYHPGEKLAYRFENKRGTHLTWTLKPTAQGTRLTLETEYPETGSQEIEEDEDREETPEEKLDRQAQEWVNNIKRYAELDDSLPQRLLKRILDGFILEMPAFQRRVLLILIAFQFVTFLTFLIAAIGFAIARLILL